MFFISPYSANLSWMSSSVASSCTPVTKRIQPSTAAGEEGTGFSGAVERAPPPPRWSAARARSQRSDTHSAAGPAHPRPAPRCRSPHAPAPGSPPLGREGVNGAPPTPLNPIRAPRDPPQGPILTRAEASALPLLGLLLQFVDALCGQEGSGSGSEHGPGMGSAPPSRCRCRCRPSPSPSSSMAKSSPPASCRSSTSAILPLPPPPPLRCTPGGAPEGAAARRHLGEGVRVDASPPPY